MRWSGHWGEHWGLDAPSLEVALVLDREVTLYADNTGTATYNLGYRWPDERESPYSITTTVDDGTARTHYPNEDDDRHDEVYELPLGRHYVETFTVSRAGGSRTEYHVVRVLPARRGPRLSIRLLPLGMRPK